MSGVPEVSAEAGTESNRARGIISDGCLFQFTSSVAERRRRKVFWVTARGRRTEGGAVTVPPRGLAHFQPPRFPSASSVLQLRYTSFRMTRINVVKSL